MSDEAESVLQYIKDALYMQDEVVLGRQDAETLLGHVNKPVVVDERNVYHDKVKSYERQVFLLELLLLVNRNKHVQHW